MKSRGCKIYYSIAFICYLEVVLWTSLVLSGCTCISAGPEGSAYLHRETNNQGQITQINHISNLHISNLVLKAYNLHQQLESLSLQKLWSGVSETPSCRAPPCGQQLLSALTGVPAPFTGVSVVI